MYFMQACYISGCTLTLILLEPKVISLCHQYRAKPACTSMQSDRLYQLQVLTLKMIMDSPKNGRRNILFKKFNKLRVKSFHIHLCLQRFSQYCSIYTIHVVVKKEKLIVRSAISKITLEIKQEHLNVNDLTCFVCIQSIQVI